MLLLPPSERPAPELQLRPGVVPRVPEVRQALQVQDAQTTGMCEAKDAGQEMKDRPSEVLQASAPIACSLRGESTPTAKSNTLRWREWPG